MSPEQVEQVARDEADVTLSEKGKHAIRRAREVVEARLGVDAPATYGVNTGFGALAEVRIPPEDLATLQRNLVRSHAVGVGPSLNREQSRAMMLLRAQVLALGYSGVREEVVELLLQMLEDGVHPVIPSQGSVGASGDLAPLAHLALVLIGEGEAELDGVVMPGGEALTAVGLAPIELSAKEGLALINGTQGMLAIGTLAWQRARRLAAMANVTGAMTLEALKGSVLPFDAAIVEARPHPGALVTAAHLRALLADSAIGRSHVDCAEVQDAYSLRCMPQVHGAAHDVLSFVGQVLSIELNSATDNPLVLPDGRIQSGGNFHGQPVAVALDAATAAVADLASIAERRIFQLTDHSLSRGLPPFLATNPGLDSGFMMAQVTAAALVAESRVLSFPKSTDTVPTSADREDHVSMGMTAARHFHAVVHMAEHVIAIEACAAAQGITLRGLRPGAGVGRAFDLVRTVVPPLDGDRSMTPDFAAVRQLIRSGELLEVTKGLSS